MADNRLSAQVKFIMHKTQFEYWEHAYPTLDAIPRHDGMFSLKQARQGGVSSSVPDYPRIRSWSR
ncbi:DUF779 domain-containing protein [Methylobacillus arboreus]|uniref:DUF779 domain-containing protein n=1 Tax=Methylobacillus arboreus TaxID=755170 RepID=UPI001E4A696D|nr:DUF779 domain-containing protein [Methylobacillus arboreus]